MAKSTITSKYQTTVPKEIREKLNLSESDELQWEIRDGEIVITPAVPDFLEREGYLDSGPEPVDALKQMRESYPHN